MTRRYRSTHDLISFCEKLLKPNPRANAEEVLEEVVDELYRGRDYRAIGIYLVVDHKFICQSWRGLDTPVQSFPLGVEQSISADSNTPELAQLVKIGARILGMIYVRNASSQEPSFLDQVAKLLARYLTTDQGKLLFRKARKNSPNVEAEPHKRPQSARAGLTLAAAAERAR